MDATSELIEYDIDIWAYEVAFKWVLVLGSFITCFSLISGLLKAYQRGF